jgi:hypothetical protein
MTTLAEAHPAWDRRRLVYGDWTWLVRDGLDVLRLAFIAGTIVFAVQGRSTAVALTAASAVLLIARVIDLPRWFDFGLIVAMSLIAWGTALSLYGSWFYYDKIVHGLSPVGYVPVLYIALVRLGVVPDPVTRSANGESRESAASSSSRSRSAWPWAPATRASSGSRTNSSAATSSEGSGTPRQTSCATKAVRRSVQLF